MIYTTFKQWKDGNFLETGEPRKKAYSKDELALIEMGWNYGYDAGQAAEREACAKEADAWTNNCVWEARTAAANIANSIRKRGQA